jgi:hypothetical protein
MPSKQGLREPERPKAFSSSAIEWENFDLNAAISFLQTQIPRRPPSAFQHLTTIE